MPEPTSPTPISLWLEEALSGWGLPAAALALVAIAGVLYLTGRLGEGWVAAAIVVAVAVLAAGYLAREAVAPRVDLLARNMLWASAAGVLVLATWPAVRTVVPGAPMAAGDLGAVGDTLALPRGGTVRVLVQAQLPSEGTPTVGFRIGGVQPPAEGRLERTYSYARVGRGGRTRVAHDHSSMYLEARVAPGGTLRLDRLTGEPVGPLHVAVFPEPLPTWLFIAIALVIAVGGAIADARLRKGNAAAVTAMALAFAIIVTENATPASAIGTTFGAILLGAISGAIAGVVLAAVARRIVPPPASRAARG